MELSSSYQEGGPAQGRNHLLIIGIDDYLHWPRLHNAVRDARTFAEALCRHYQFEEADVLKLFNEEATEGGIYQAIRELKRRVGPNDSLIVYFSGHGHYDREFDEGYWVPYNGGRDAEETYISNANILKRINALDGHHILLIVDSCFSGSLLTTTRSAQVDEHFPSRRVLCSGRLEAVSDGAPGTHSPFAHLLIARLRENTAPALDTTTLIQHIKAHIGKQSKQAPVDGRLQHSADRGGEFVFHLKVGEADYWARISQQGGIEGYEQYLNTYPQGKYAAEAARQLLLLREDAVWARARQNHNELAYRNYLRQYAGTGKYLQAAEEQLQGLEAQQEERRKVLEKLAQQDAEREGIQQKFQQLVDEAEGLFQQEQLEPARGRYRESLQYYMDGFTPSYSYIEEQINLCANGLAFLQHLQKGREAMGRGNHRLALQYFQEAARHGDDPKLEDLIRVCRQKLGQQQARPEPENQQRARASSSRGADGANAAKTGRLILKMMGWGIGAIIVLVLIGIYWPGEGPAYPPAAYTPPGQEAQGLGGSHTEALPSSYTALVVGSWSLEDILINGQPYSYVTGDFLNWEQYGYTFYANGAALSRTPQGNEQQTYRIQGDYIYVHSPIWGGSPGLIRQLDRHHMKLLFYIPDGMGGTMAYEVSFTR